MAIPKSIIKTQKTKNGKIELQYINNVDRVNYTLKELVRAALRDSGSYLLKQVKEAAPVRTGLLKKALDKKVSKDKSGQYVLKIGTRKKSAATDKKPYAPHAHLVILGHATKSGGFVKGNNFIEDVTKQNIDTIRNIQGKYLSAIEDEQAAMELIKDNDKSEDE